MLGYRVVTKLGLFLALAAPLATAACGGSKGSGPKVVKLQPGDMPADGNWTGVYYSQLFGHLHVVSDGDAVMGRWRTAAGDKWGELHGEATGDLLRYEWTEHKIGMVGPNAKQSGKGYFRYIVPDGENVDHEIHGEWGLGADETGNPWEAIKQRNQAPDPDSVMPDETQRARGGGWDEGSSSGGGEDEGGGWD